MEGRKISEKMGRMEESRITLRDFRKEDVDDFMKWAMDERVTEYTSWYAHESRESVENYMEKEVLTHPFYKAICVDGRPVGAISVNRGEGVAQCRGEVGYLIAYDFWGKGIATCALRMAVRKAFEDIEDLQRIEALVEPGNVASQKVVANSGFIKEGLLLSYLIMKGTLRDFFIYRFLRSDLPSVT